MLTALLLVDIGETGMLFKQIHHFALVVPDLNASVNWYSDALGFRPERRFAFPEAGVQIAHLVTDTGIRVELIQQDGSAQGPDAGQGMTPKKLFES